MVAKIVNLANEKKCRTKGGGCKRLIIGRVITSAEDGSLREGKQCYDNPIVVILPYTKYQYDRHIL